MILLFLTLFCDPWPAFAQDLQGNDTASNWRVSHYVAFGIWNSICDEREEQGALKQRCYIRRADVFSLRPRFAAQYMFITPDPDGYAVEFGIEPGTVFSPSGFRIEKAGKTLWRTRRPGCLFGLGCMFQGTRAQGVVKAMLEGDALRFVFRDAHGQSQDLTWALDGFDAAWRDFHTQSRARNLLQPAQ